MKQLLVAVESDTAPIQHKPVAYRVRNMAAVGEKYGYFTDEQMALLAPGCNNPSIFEPLYTMEPTGTQRLEAFVSAAESNASTHELSSANSLGVKK